MKVSLIWRSLAFMFLGFALGTLLSTLVFVNNIPPGTEISIGRVKLKGQDQAIENLIKTGDITSESKKEARQSRRLARREKK